MVTASGSITPISFMDVAILAYFLEPVIRHVMGLSGNRASIGRLKIFCSNDIRIGPNISYLCKTEALGDRLWKCCHPLGTQQSDEVVLG